MQRPSPGQAAWPGAATSRDVPVPLSPPPPSPTPRPQHLVHALAALALMGLADLWLVMNLSAQFAHAKRDITDIKR